MELSNILKKRKSIRSYIPKPVDRDLILRCIDAAHLAPSACNIQPWKFIIVDDPDIKEKLINESLSGVHSFNQFVQNAGALVVVVARKDLLTHKLFASLQGTQFYLLDIGAACENFILKATELGIGTCWLGWFNEKKTKKILHIPRMLKIPSIIAVGHYDETEYESKERQRKNIKEVYSFNRYEKIPGE